MNPLRFSLEIGPDVFDGDDIIPNFSVVGMGSVEIDGKGRNSNHLLAVSVYAPADGAMCKRSLGR